MHRTPVSLQRRITLSTVLGLLIIGGRSLVAQSTPDDFLQRSMSDSTAWERVLVYVVGTLSVELLREAADSGARPWRLRLPAHEPQEPLLERELRTILRARDVTPNDTIFHSLTIGPLNIAGDTARVDVSFGETRNCHGTTHTTGYGWKTTVLVPRDPKQKIWRGAFSRSTLAGDRVGC